MELREIEIFLTLAEELHFGRTAERLHLTQSRVSQSIKKQERRLGAPLFDRNNRMVRLTDLGVQLRSDLVPGYRQIQDAVARASATGRGLAGVLRVGVQAAWSGDLVLAAATTFTAANPDSDIQIREVPLSDPFGGLRAGQLDLQLTVRPAEEAGLTAGPTIFSLPRVLVIASGHPFAQRSAISMEDLADVRMLTVAGPPDYWIDHHLPARTPGGRPILRGTAVAEWETAWSQVASGKGAFIAGNWAADDRYHYSRSGLAFVPIIDAAPVEWGLLWRSDAATVLLTSFVKVVLAQREAMLIGDEPHSSHHSEGVVDRRPDSLKTEINRRSAESSTKEKKMKANVSSILLGVGDMERTKRFYTEGLSWTIERDFGPSVFFALDGGPLVGFYGREGLAAEMGTSPEGSGFSGLALTYVVRTEERVDEILAEAEKAGAAILKPAAATPWGGYGGTFADPDGYIWSIGYSAHAEGQPYAE